MLSSNSFRQFDWKVSERSAVIILTVVNFSHTIWDRVVIQFNQKSCIMEIAKIDGRIRCGNGNGQCNEHVCMCVSEFNVDLSGSLWATKAGPKFYKPFSNYTIDRFNSHLKQPPFPLWFYRIWSKAKDFIFAVQVYRAMLPMPRILQFLFGPNNNGKKSLIRNSWKVLCNVLYAEHIGNEIESHSWSPGNLILSSDITLHDENENKNHNRFISGEWRKRLKLSHSNLHNFTHYQIEVEDLTI